MQKDKDLRAITFEWVRASTSLYDLQQQLRLQSGWNTAVPPCRGLRLLQTIPVATSSNTREL